MKKEINFTFFDKKGNYAPGVTDYYHCTELEVKEEDSYDGTAITIARRAIHNTRGSINSNGRLMSFTPKEARIIFELLQKVLNKEGA